MVDISGGWVRPGTPNPPPLVSKKVTIFGHKKSDLKPAVLGSPQPVHVHGGGGGGDAMTHMTGTEPCGCNIVNVIQCPSMPFTVITHSDNIVLLAAATTT